MQALQTNHVNSYESRDNLESLHVDFMDIAHDLHQKQSKSKKKDRAKQRSNARKAIEMHQENRRLKAELKEWWEEI